MVEHFFEVEVIEEKPDLEIEAPQLLVGIASPNMPQIDENLLVKELKDAMPVRLGADNVFDLDIPRLPQSHPEEPHIGQDCVVVQKEE